MKRHQQTLVHLHDATIGQFYREVQRWEQVLGRTADIEDSPDGGASGNLRVVATVGELLEDERIVVFLHGDR